MKILIVGARGQLGYEIAECFKRGCTELGTPDILKEENDISLVDIDTLDISDSHAVNTLLDKEKYGAVINCAAYTNVNKCESDKITAFKANVLGARNLATASESIGAKLVHISTDYVFSGDGDTPYTEWDICAPESIYGKTKHLGEEYVRDFSTRYFLIRTAWLYGYHGSNFVKTMRKIALEKGEVRVVCDQIGNPTNAAELAHHILKLITTEEYGIYHATGNGECSWYEFAKKIIELSKIDAEVIPCTTDEYPTPAKRPAYSSLENMMLRATVGDEFREWERALECFINNLNDRKGLI